MLAVKFSRKFHINCELQGLYLFLDRSEVADSILCNFAADSMRDNNVRHDHKIPDSVRDMNVANQHGGFLLVASLSLLLRSHRVRLRAFRIRNLRLEALGFGLQIQ